MNFSEFLFILQILFFLGIFLVTLYNIFTVGKFYDMRMMFILFVGIGFAYLIGMFVVMTFYETEIFGQIFGMESWLFRLYGIFLVIQLFMYWQSEAVRPKSARKAAMLREERGDG